MDMRGKEGKWEMGEERRGRQGRQRREGTAGEGCRGVANGWGVSERSYSFQAFTSEEDAEWYCSLRANQGSLLSAAEDFSSFLTSQCAAFVSRGEYASLLLLTLLSLPHISLAERMPLLSDLTSLFRSDGVEAAALSHECLALHGAMLSLLPPPLPLRLPSPSPDGKRERARAVVAQQSARVERRLRHFFTRVEWGDVVPVSYR